MVKRIAAGRLPLASTMDAACQQGYSAIDAALDQLARKIGFLGNSSGDQTGNGSLPWYGSTVWLAALPCRVLSITTHSGGKNDAFSPFAIDDELGNKAAVS